MEDETFTRELVSVALQGAGYRVTAVSDGESALREIDRQYPDLAILDIRLPGIDGWELCRRLRSRVELPVIFLSSLRDDEHIVKGLRSGGDDYLVKPFSPLVLVAHVEAVLRRTSAAAAPEPIRLPGLTLDLARNAVSRDGQRVHLTVTELRMLMALARHRGVCLSARQLISEAQDISIAEREARPLVKVHIRNLRQKIEPVPRTPRYVLTVRGLGYMLAADDPEPNA